MSAANRCLVIAIDAVPAPLAAWLAEQTRNVRAPLLEVMVVDRDSVRRIAIADAFRAEGCHVLEAGTALEAFDELEGASFTTDVFAVADTEPDSIGIDLRNHLDGAYLDALVVGVGDPQSTPTRSRLSANTVEGKLQGRVRALLLARAGAHPIHSATTAD